MTVRELQAELSKANPDAVVVLDDGNTCYLCGLETHPNGTIRLPAAFVLFWSPEMFEEEDGKLVASAS